MTGDENIAMAALTAIRNLRGLAGTENSEVSVLPTFRPFEQLSIA